MDEAVAAAETFSNAIGAVEEKLHASFYFYFLLSPTLFVSFGGADTCVCSCACACVPVRVCVFVCLCLFVCLHASVCVHAFSPLIACFLWCR